MRFSLLGLIAIVTVAGFSISLFSTYHEFRQANAQLATISAEIKGGTYAATRFRETSVELGPYVAKLEKAFAARAEMERRAEVILEELTPEQSKIVPVEGKISIRRIPAISKILDHRQGFAIFVPDSCKCEIKMLFDAGEIELFEGFESESTFPLLNGLNEVRFRLTSADGSTQMALTINGEVVAKAVANGHESTGGSYSLSNLFFDPQVDYSLATLLKPAKHPRRLPELLDYEPRMGANSKLQPSVELHLRLVREASSSE